MARSFNDIKNELTTRFMSYEVIQTAYGFAPGTLFPDEFSQVSLENILFDVFAYCVLVLEQIFDQHKKEVDWAIYEQKSGTPRWYRNMALAFQYGFSLLTDDDQFDNTGFTVDQIAASKIVKYCSVKESLESGRLTIKVAGESGGTLVPLSTGQLESFSEYINEIKYAGVKLTVINNPADKLQLIMQVYRDVLVLDENGTSIQNATKPVELAIKDYMKTLPFDGELVINDLIEKLRAVEGVDNVNILLASSSSFDPTTDSYNDFGPINVKTIPVAGYFEVENFDTVSYVV